MRVLSGLPSGLLRKRQVKYTDKTFKIKSLSEVDTKYSYTLYAAKI